MSRADTNNSHLTSWNTNANMNSSSLSSSPLSSSSFLSSSYSSPSPLFSKLPPIMNSTGVSSTSVVNHSAGTTSTSGASVTPRSIVKAKRSLVWRYFKVTINDLLNVESVLCSSIICRKTSSTSNLLYHMQTHHSLEYLNLNKSMKLQGRQSDLTGRLPLTSDRALYLNKLVADVIIRNFLPPSIVESSELKTIFHKAEPSYVIPSRKYFINNVLKAMYKEIRDKVYAELQVSHGIQADILFEF
ncbi:unnamed protein product [Rotaria magnacalcarata]|uniref:BED-type domain-containing protein n=1 Tax=Rotaria magnacalcarata TaxID=392030 RepID=A0A816SMA7_9BILA|nr:unnamed protein product [Rotaria magnacalcarata]CAF2128961.1 unnamed protein product [Rotaria magnacalcarata]CAF4150154.1 unnamed protein product [Rotaria magnacalcarata]